MKRRLRILLAPILLGIVNVAVAWSFECRDYPGKVTAEALTDQDARSAMPVHGAPAAAPLTGVTGTGETVPGRSQHLLLAFHHEMTDDGPIRYANQLFVVCAGWPCRSMQGWTGLGRTPSETGKHGFWRTAWFPCSKYSRVRTYGLPFLPRWPGFAINTILNTWIFWMLLAICWTPAYVRRWRRFRRGPCPACGYQVGVSLLCTESGKPVSPLNRG